MVRAVRGQHKLGYLFDPWCAHFPVCSCRCCKQWLPLLLRS